MYSIFNSEAVRIEGTTVPNLFYVDTTGAGRVGIGVIPSTAKLHILQDTVGTSAKALSVNFNTIGEVFYIDDNGQSEFNANAGVRIRGSNAILDLVSNGGTQPNINFYYNNGSNTSGILRGSSASMEMVTPLFSISTVGGFTPLATTHIRGAGATNATTSLLVQNSTPTTLFFVRDDGAVSSTNGYWIGTTKFLHSGAAGDSTDVYIGSNVASSYSSAGSNVGIGLNALSAHTTSVQQTAVGSGALAAANIQQSTGIGFNALNASTGYQNTAVGASAGAPLVSGIQNVFFGYAAGMSGAGAVDVTTGSSNIFLGWLAGSNNATRNNSIAIGTAAYVNADNQCSIGGQVALGTQILDFAVGCNVIESNAGVLAAGPYETTIRTTHVATGVSDTSNPFPFTIAGGRSTGTGTGSDISFKVSLAGTTGSSQNAYATAMTISAQQTFTAVGVGVTGPTARMQIRGSGATSGTTSLLVQNSTPTSIFFVRDDQMVSANLGYSIGGVRTYHENTTLGSAANIWIGGLNSFSQTTAAVRNIFIGLMADGGLADDGTNFYNNWVGYAGGGRSITSTNMQYNMWFGNAILETAGSGSTTGTFQHTVLLGTAIKYRGTASATRVGVIAIGSNVDFYDSNSMLIGSSDETAWIEGVYLGQGQYLNTGSFALKNLKIQPTSPVAGANLSANVDFRLAGRQGTGTGVGGDVVLQVAPAGASSSTHNTLVDAVTVSAQHTFAAVGIAEDAPTARLQVKGAGTSSSTVALRVTDSNSSETFMLKDDHSMEFHGIASGYASSEYVTKQAGVQTTDETTTTIATISTANDEMIIVRGIVSGFRSTFAESFGAGFFAVFYNNGGVLAQVGTTDVTSKTNFSGSPSITVDSSGTDVRIRVTGPTVSPDATVNWTTTYTYQKTKTNS